MAITKLQKQVNKQYRESKPPIAFFDIDDTLVFTNPYRITNKNALIEDRQTIIDGKIRHIFHFSPLKPICDLTRWCKLNGIGIIILTARPKKSYYATVSNLNTYKIPFDEVITNDNNEHFIFKSKIRKKYSKKYNILLTIGDNWYDVVDPGKAMGIKLPDVSDRQCYVF